jgi:excinuclease ABC subunit A
VANKKKPAGSEIVVLGARVHNLKNIDVAIPRNKLTVITGLSGSGKSSLAFDTIHAEGQRRFLETLSAYARQFLGNMERPDVDKIYGLSPVISIEQKTVNRNPRSTVGTITEIYDFLRLLYARAGIAYSHVSGERMVKYTDDQIIRLIMDKFKGKTIGLLAPVVRGRKGHYKELFEQMRRKGFLYARVNGEIVEMTRGMKVDRYKTHSIEIVIDRLQVSKDDTRRIRESFLTAMMHGKGLIMVHDPDTNKIYYFSRQLMCPVSGISYNEPAPHTFSFNSPQGACPRCNGLGTISEIDVSKVFPQPELSVRKGGIEPLGPYRNALVFWQIEAVLQKFGLTLDSPVKHISPEALEIILHGSEETFALRNTPLGASTTYHLSFDGIMNYIEANSLSEEKQVKWNQGYVRDKVCPECQGTRLKMEALQFRIHDKNIAEVAAMDIGHIHSWLEGIEDKLEERQRIIAHEILKEIRNRLHFLIEVGLEYLSLNRSARSLSGGESQRIRLATQIGSRLVNVLYILDEPSIGLHQRDNRKLIRALKELRDMGNTIIVVEHDKEIILSADHLIDLGPRAGRHGGQVIAAGTPADILTTDSLTAQYLTRKKQIEVPASRRKENGKYLVLKGARGNNLKNITVKFPLGNFICITGVSGSGKSTLMNMTLLPVLFRVLYRSSREPLDYDTVEGLANIDKVIEVDQSPLGRTPRSNPATYTGVFSDIRKLFEQTPEAKIRGYKAGRFSFNVKGGRCEGCQGAGVKTIEMNFLPDVYVHCDDCNGKRYNRETLEVKYKGKSIGDVLEMTITQAVEFFENVPSINQKIRTLEEVGLGYVKLGQPSTTLSGGESQRVKLATELAKRDTGRTIYVLDEPTTGLHFEDIHVLLTVLNKLVDRGNTVIVIEHNMEVIKVADYIIDLGREGGERGGEVIAIGTPEQVARNRKSYTAEFLKKELVFGR